MAKRYIYNVVCEDATHLGGAMGTEYTTIKWTRHFASNAKAVKFAEAHIAKYSTPEYPNELERHGERQVCDTGHEIIIVYRAELL